MLVYSIISIGEYHTGNKRVVLSVVSKYGCISYSIYKYYVGMVSTVVSYCSYNCDVLLSRAGSEGEIESTGSLLENYVNSIEIILGGCEVEAVHCAGEVECLTEVALVEEELVCSTRNRGGNNLRNKIRPLRRDFERLCLGCIPERKSCSNYDSSSLVRRSDGHNSTGNNNHIVVFCSSPRDKNLTEELTVSRKVYGGVKLILSIDNKIVLLALNHLCISLSSSVDESCKVCGELSDTYVSSISTGDVGDVGKAEGVVLVVATEVTSLGYGFGSILRKNDYVNGEHLELSVILEVVSNFILDVFSVERNCGGSARCIVVYVDVLSRTVDINVEIVLIGSTINKLCYDVSSLSRIGGTNKVVAIILTGPVENLAKVILSYNELILSAGYNGDSGVCNKLGSSVDSYGVLLNNGGLAEGKSEGKSDVLRLIGKYGNVEHVAIEGSILGFCKRPGEGNVLVGLSLALESLVACLGNCANCIENELLDCNLLGIGTLSGGNVVDRGCSYGDEVHLVVVDGYDTGYVSILMGSVLVCILECGGSSIIHHVCRTGDSEIAHLVANKEVVVGGVAGNLTGDESTLDGYEHGLILSNVLNGKVLSSKNVSGDVLSSKSYGSSIENLDGSILNLVYAVVRALNTGYANLLAYLEVLNLILLKSVYVVSTVVVLEVELPLRGGVNDTRDDTLNDNGLIVCGGGELCVSKLNELRHLAVIRGGDGLSLGVLDSSGKHVGDISLSLLVYVDSSGAILGNNYLNVCIGDGSTISARYGPGNLVLNVLTVLVHREDVIYNVVSRGCLCLALILRVKVVLDICELVINRLAETKSAHNAILNTVKGSLDVEAGPLLDLCAGGKTSNAENNYENQ